MFYFILLYYFILQYMWINAVTTVIIFFYTEIFSYHTNNCLLAVLQWIDIWKYMLEKYAVVRVCCCRLLLTSHVFRPRRCCHMNREYLDSHYIHSFLLERIKTSLHVTSENVSRMYVALKFRVSSIGKSAEIPVFCEESLWSNKCKKRCNNRTDNLQPCSIYCWNS